MTSISNRQLFQLFFEHPHTWLLVRIFSVIRLFLFFDIFTGFFLLVDVARTLFLNNENQSVESQTEKNDFQGETVEFGIQTTAITTPTAVIENGCQTENLANDPSFPEAVDAECQTYELQVYDTDCQTEITVVIKIDQECQSDFFYQPNYQENAVDLEILPLDIQTDNSVIIEMNCQTENFIEQRPVQVNLTESFRKTEHCDASGDVSLLDLRMLQSTEAFSQTDVVDAESMILLSNDDQTGLQETEFGVLSSGTGSVTSSHEVFTLDDGYSTDNKEPGISVACQTETVEVEIPVENLLDFLDVTAVHSPAASVDSGIQTEQGETDACGVQTCLVDVLEDVLARSSFSIGFGKVATKEMDFLVNEDLCREIEKTRADLREAVEQNMEMQSSIISLRANNDALMLTIAGDRKEIDGLRDQLNTITEELNELAALPTHTTLPMQSSHDPTGVSVEEMASVIVDLEERLEKKSADLHQVEQALIKARSDLALRPDIKLDVFQNFCTEYDQLRTKLMQMEAEKKEEKVSSSPNELTEMIDSLKNDLETKNVRVEELSEELRNMETRLIEYEKSLDQDRQEIEELEKALKDSRLTCSVKECKIEDLCEEMEEWKNNVEKMRMDVEKMTESAKLNLHQSILHRSTREHATSPHKTMHPVMLVPTSPEKFSKWTETDPKIGVETISIGTSTDPLLEIATKPILVAPPMSYGPTTVQSSPLQSLLSGYTSNIVNARGPTSLTGSAGRHAMPAFSRPMSPIHEKRKANELLSSGIKQSGGGLRKKVQFTSGKSSIPELNFYPSDIDRRSTIGVTQAGFPSLVSDFGMKRPVSRIPHAPGIRRSTQAKPVTPLSKFQYRSKEFVFQPNNMPESASRRPGPGMSSRPSYANAQAPECKQQ